MSKYVTEEALIKLIQLIKSNGYGSGSSNSSDDIEEIKNTIEDLKAQVAILNYQLNANFSVKLNSENDSITLSNGVGTYDVYFADSNIQVIDTYGKLCSLTVDGEGNATFSGLIENNVYPNSVHSLVACTSGTTDIVAVSNISTNKKIDTISKGKKLYRVGLLSDLHIVGDSSYHSEEDFENALNYFKNTVKADFVCITGDLTDGGTTAQFTEYKRIKDLYNENMPIYACGGNHDTYQGEISNLELESVAGHPFDNKVVVGNDVLLFLTLAYDMQGGSCMRTTTFGWLSKELEANKDKRVFLFAHHYLCDVGNPAFVYSSGEFYTYASGSDCLNLRILLSKYQNVTLFAGHSHYTPSEQLKGYPKTCLSDSEYPYGRQVHIPSCGKPRVLNSDLSAYVSKNDQSCGVVMDVYEKGIYLNYIDFSGETSIDGYENNPIPYGQYYLETPIPTHKTRYTYATTNDLGTPYSKSSTVTVSGNTFTFTAKSTEVSYRLGKIKYKPDAPIYIKYTLTTSDGTVINPETDLLGLQLSLCTDAEYSNYFYSQTSYYSAKGEGTLYNAPRYYATGGSLTNRIELYTMFKIRMSSGFGLTLPITVTLTDFEIYQDFEVENTQGLLFELDGTSGTIEDISGNNVQITNNGCTSIVGEGIHINTNYLSLPISCINNDSEYTIEATIVVGNDLSGDIRIVEYGNTSTNKVALKLISMANYTKFYPSLVCFDTTNDSGIYDLYSDNCRHTVVPNQLVHLMITKETSGRRMLYINGKRMSHTFGGTMDMTNVSKVNIGCKFDSITLSKEYILKSLKIYNYYMSGELIHNKFIKIFAENGGGE